MDPEVELKRALALLAMLLIGSASAASELNGTYRVGPRDVLHVEVFGEPDCTREVRVSETGHMTLPYIGTFDAKGLTLHELSREIERRYLDGILLKPEVAVAVKEYRSKPFQLVGAVKSPGVYYLNRPITVREALGEAGWINTEKSSRQVSVRRADGRELRLSVEDVIRGEAGEQPVLPGDVIAVEEGKWVYVSGQVGSPGAVLFHDGLTVYQALLKAGDVAPTARLRRAYLVREDGERVKVNLKRIRDNKEPDIQMQPGDRLMVHESPL